MRCGIILYEPRLYKRAALEERRWLFRIMLVKREHDRIDASGEITKRYSCAKLRRSVVRKWEGYYSLLVIMV